MRLLYRILAVSAAFNVGAWFGGYLGNEISIVWLAVWLAFLVFSFLPYFLPSEEEFGLGLDVIVGRADGEWMAIEAYTAQYGNGPTVSRALSSLGDSLQIYQRYLSERGPDRLGDRLAAHLEYLNERLPRVH